MTASSEITVTPRQPVIGAEVRGIDLARAMNAPTLDRLRQIWLENPVLVFPAQAITDAQQIAFARRFGALEIHPSPTHRASAHPEIYRVANTDEAGNILPPQGTAWQYLELTWIWHTDSSFRPVPSMGSVLHGIEIAPEGGDTLFANMYAAYDALPAAMKQRIAGLRAEHDHDYIIGLSSGLNGKRDTGSYEELPPVEHPLVRRHPLTGKPSLFLSPHTMAGIAGMAAADGRALLDELIAFATQERFVYRHQWQKDDVLMWDNRCTMHAVTPYDSATHRRIMHRTTIVGDGPPIPWLS